MCLSNTVNDTFSVEYWRDLEIWVRGHSRSLEMAPFDRLHTSSYSPCAPCIVFKIKRDIGRKCQFFIRRFHLTCTITNNLLDFSPKILIQTVRVPKSPQAIRWCKNILPSTLCVGRNNVTDRRQTDGQCDRVNAT